MRKHAHACISMHGSGGMFLQENFEFRSSQITSDAIWDKIVVYTCDKTLLIIPNFKFFFVFFLGGGGGGGGGV